MQETERERAREQEGGGGEKSMAITFVITLEE